jgi:hypothetical protein
MHGKLTLAALVLWAFSTAPVQASWLARRNYRPMILSAEAGAENPGKKILAKGRDMTLTRRLVLPGACWDYINAVYERAGYPSSRRHIVFKKSRRGPYADPAQIEAGDWLYYLNHSYGGVEHSAIFVAWIDLASKKALMLSYPGENRAVPARYLPYDLSNVTTIVRPKA